MTSNGGEAPPNPSGGLLRDLIRPPFRQFSIDTELSEAEVVERLRAIVEPGNAFLASLRRTNKLFAGEVSTEGFKIMRLIYYSNGFQPVVTGRFDHPGPRGTRVQVGMRLRQYASAFVALWLGMLALIVFVALFEAVFSSPKKGVGNWLEGVGFATSIGAIAYLMVAVSFGAEARKARGLLDEALQPTPGPRIQNVLSGAPSALPRFVKHLFGVGVLALLFSAVSLAVPHLMIRSEPYHIAESYIRLNPVVQEELGRILSINLELSGNNVSYVGREGSARFAFEIDAARSKGVVLVSMKKQLGVWRVSTADLREPSGRIVSLRADEPAATTAPNP